MTYIVSGKVFGHVLSFEMTFIPVILVRDMIFFQILEYDLGSPNAEKNTFSKLSQQSDQTQDYR